MEKIKIELVDINDVDDLLKIYGYYVENTAITFEYEVPTVEEFKKRINKILAKYPYLVAKIDDKIVGYVYASEFHERKAYQWCVETSIYVDCNYKGRGIGKMLYEGLERLLCKQNVINLNACIAFVNNEDMFLNNNSFYFHKHLGYSLVGKFNKCGYKFNTWYDMVWMEKMIGEHLDLPKDFIPFSVLKEHVRIEDLLDEIN